MSVLSECNCHGKAEECYFNQTVADLSLSLDIHGQRRGGGVCVRCRDNTAGVNCASCASGFFRPAEVRHVPPVCSFSSPSGRSLNVTHLSLCVCVCLLVVFSPDQMRADDEDPCVPCSCDSRGSVSQTCVPDSSQATPGKYKKKKNL